MEIKWPLALLRDGWVDPCIELKRARGAGSPLSREGYAGEGHASLDAATVGGLPPHVLERISYVIGIYRALRTIFPDRLQANTWVRRANAVALFNGDTVIAVMCSGGVDGPSSVRQYLEAGGIVDV